MSIHTIAADLAAAFLQGDVEQFMAPFDLDLVSDYYLRRWFNGYAVKVAAPQACRVEHVSEQRLQFRLEYKGYETETAVFTISLNKAQTKIEVADVKLSQPKLLPADPQQMPQQRLPLLTKLPPEPVAWWAPDPVNDIARASVDAHKAAFYARAVPKSTRYRSTHPEIDSAAVLAHFLSRRLIELAYTWQNAAPVEFIHQLLHFGQRLMVGKTYDELRQADKNYFPARELSLQTLFGWDEIFAMSRENGFGAAEVGCPEIAAFYVALCRLYGLAPDEAFIITQPFHYLTYLQVAQQTQVISVHDLIPMTPARLYGDTEVTRIVLPTGYLDADGTTNMQPDFLHSLSRRLKRQLPLFQLPQANHGERPLPAQAEPAHTIRTHDNPHDLYRALRQHIFTCSRDYPDSPATWAKYVHQTLLVHQPQAYAIWSIRAPEVKAFGQQYQTPTQVLGWINEYVRDGSMFTEGDRIMTADQVLRLRCGAAHDRALLLFAASYAGGACDGGGVIMTSTDSYAVLTHAGEQCLFAMQAGEQCAAISGRLVLAFGLDASYDPWRSTPQTAPWWLTAYWQTAMMETRS